MPGQKSVHRPFFSQSPKRVGSRPFLPPISTAAGGPVCLPLSAAPAFPSFDESATGSGFFVGVESLFFSVPDIFVLLSRRA